MDKLVIVLSGMPASGKDTVTDRLNQLDKRYVYFKKYRAIGPEDTPKDTYYNISHEDFEKKIAKGDFLQYHSRYGRYYGIDAITLKEMFEQDLIPVIHIGRIDNFYTLKKNLPAFEEKYGYNVRLLHIQLWETKESLKARIATRDKTEEEIGKRVAAMDQEFHDAISMMKNEERPFTVVIQNTDIIITCGTILALEKEKNCFDDGYDAFWNYLRTL